MYSFLIVLLVSAGTLLLYLANRHQRLVKKPLTYLFKPVGYMFLLLGGVTALINFSVSAGVFVWLMLLMTTLFSIPLTVLLLKRGQ
ncbi:hypothetical protein A7985_04275 [Pseudoalteromonas luteoviolacea]|uniref:DUF3325 domain-containing protein n=1 Tax=Pseudoalteromonas luteoviolacea TaxID=43657 RepID=A0A1C0TV32_9GAMM|nr:hypothetical protein [Pseudoalteromonas luteoviolacea]MBQ4809713.1 hypothetical protein [Pseudoalteromonas luteoviolacea]OCQ23171.1 hypothetical protein A7985_04275 [Pseudoalteromonas luteoviolacea]